MARNMCRSRSVYVDDDTSSFCWCGRDIRPGIPDFGGPVAPPDAHRVGGFLSPVQPGFLAIDRYGEVVDIADADLAGGERSLAAA